MRSHPVILSIREAFLAAGLLDINISESISDLDTTKEIGENVTVTLDDVEYASNVAIALRGHFASKHPKIKGKVELITKMYHTAVESTYYNATFFRNLESDIASVQTATNRAQITADNAQTAHQNSHRQYTEKFCALKKVTTGSGFDFAEAVRPEHVNRDILNDTTTTPAQVGSTPLNFNGQIATYSDEDILKMIVFYNNQFGIIGSDVLLERINKFRSFLSDCGEM